MTETGSAPSRAQRYGVDLAMLGAFVFTLGLVIFAYRGLAANAFVRDDFAWLYDASRQWDDLATFFTWRPNDYFRPVSNLVFGLEWVAFERSAAGYYVINVLVHLWNAVWLGFLIGQLYRNRWTGCVAMILFASFARPADSVLWISALVTLLVAALLLPALLAHLAYLRTGRRGFLVISLLLSIACMCAKESGVVVLPLLVLLELRVRGWRTLARPAVWCRYLLLLVLAGTYVWWQARFFGDATQRVDIGPVNSLLALAKATALVFLALISPLLDRSPGAADLIPGLIAVGVTLALLLAAGGRRALGRGFEALLALGLLLGPFVPFLLVRLTLADRYLYLPALGVATLLALVATTLPARLSGNARRIATLLAALLVVGFATVGADQARDRVENNFRFRSYGNATRRLAEGLEAELARSRDKLLDSGRRWLLVGAPVERLRHLRCQFHLFLELPMESLDLVRIPLADLEAGSVDEQLLEKLEADRLLVFLGDRGLFRYDPERRGDDMRLDRALRRNWTSAVRPATEARVLVLKF